MYREFLSAALLAVLALFTVQAQSEGQVESTAAFLKDMERKASSISSDQAKWIRRDFSYAFEDESVTEAFRNKSFVVRDLEAGIVWCSDGIS